MKISFPTFQKIVLHPSFVYMQIDSSVFNPLYDRDFSIEGNCVKGESRGTQLYFPPKGWYRYGLKVNGRYDNGNDIWLGMSNIPGEWCVAYHGTDSKNVKGILTSPLKAGCGDCYGKGIYCTPDVDTAEDYCKNPLTLDLGDGKKQYKYVFMCRVNVSNIHNCTNTPCPEAEDPKYTIHFTTYKPCWFVNLNNSKYENIRPYGILIKGE
jgi:hypothetical protein